MPGTIEQSLDRSPLAGNLAPKRILVDVARLERECHSRRPDLDHPSHLLDFGTSGHLCSRCVALPLRLTSSRNAPMPCLPISIPR